MSASIALIPVWTGVSTDLRTMTPGAMRSTGRVRFVSIGPLSSSARDELITQPLEPATHTRVEQAVADPYGQPANESFVDPDIELDVRSRHRAQSLLERIRFLVGQRRGAGH